MPFTVDVPDLPSRLAVGVPVPAGEWDVEASFALPDLLVAILIGPPEASPSDRPARPPLSTTGRRCPVDLTSALEALPVAEPLDLPLTGSNREFVPGDVGEVALTLPGLRPRPDQHPRRTAVLGPLRAGGPRGRRDRDGRRRQADVLDHWQGAQEAGQVDQARQGAGHCPEPARQGANGIVVATLGDRSIGSGTLDHGAARLRLDRLPVGKHRVTLTYQGSRTVAKSMKKVTVKVVPPKH